LRVLDKTECAPKIAIRINVKITPVPCGYYARRFPGMFFIAHAAMDMFRESAHVLHDELRMFEDMCVDTLQDEFILRIERDDVCVVDVAVAKIPDVEDIPAWIELPGNKGEFFQ
jgi:hypothetical protein